MSFLSRTFDSFQNFAARVGLGTDNQHSHSTYGINYTSRNRQQLEAMYRSSWVVGKVVDVVAEDMTREGIDIKGELDPTDIVKLQNEFDKLLLWDRIEEAIKWSRLYGGAIVVAMIDGQKLDEPLDITTIGKGQFKGFLVFDRWMANPDLNSLITELGPHFGQPKYYTTIADGTWVKTQRIHYSRVMRLEGVRLPHWQKQTEMGWGQSVVERLFDRLTHYDSTTLGAGQLVYKAHLRTYKVKGLRGIIASGGKLMEGLVKQIEFLRLFQSNEGITLMDTEDVFETHQYSFAGLNDVLMQFGQQLSGAADIPLVRMFGQSPAGFNTGDADLKSYYDKIKKDQESRLRSGLRWLFEILSYSVLGRPLQDSFSFKFTPLWQMDEKQKAEVTSQITDAVLRAEEQGVIKPSIALKELKQSSEITGVFTNITDEDIEEADSQPPEPEADPPYTSPSEEGGDPLRPDAA